MKKSELNWYEGACCAIAQLVNMHGESTEVDDLIGAMGVTMKIVNQIDEADSVVLKPIIMRMKKEEVKKDSVRE